MNILITSTYYLPYISGLTVYAKRVARVLREAGATVTVLTMQHEKGLANKEVVDGVAVVRAKPGVKISKGWLSPDYFIQFAKLIKTADLVVINLPQFEGGVTAWWAKKMNKKVLSIYLCDVVLGENLWGKTTEKLVDVMSGWAIRQSDIIMNSSRDYAKASRVISGWENEVVYSYPLVEEPKKSEGEKRGKETKRAGESEQMIKVGAVGRWAREKGWEYLLEAIPMIEQLTKKKVKVVMAGPRSPAGEEVYGNKIRRLVETWAEKVEVWGEVSNTELEAVYQSMDVLVLPSINSTEAFGMVQVEAMMRGVKVVATDLPGIREIVRRTKAGKIVPVKDSRAIAEAIAELEGGKISRKWVAGQAVKVFGWKSNSKIWKEIAQGKLPKIAGKKMGQG